MSFSVKAKPLTYPEGSRSDNEIPELPDIHDVDEVDLDNGGEENEFFPFSEDNPRVGSFLPS